MVVHGIFMHSAVSLKKGFCEHGLTLLSSKLLPDCKRFMMGIFGATVTAA
jgi:hypothetical protein